MNAWGEPVSERAMHPNWEEAGPLWILNLVVNEEWSLGDDIRDKARTLFSEGLGGLRRASCCGSHGEDVAAVVRRHIRQDGRITLGSGGRVAGREPLLGGGVYLEDVISTLRERTASRGITKLVAHWRWCAVAEAMVRGLLGACARCAGLFPTG